MRTAPILQAVLLSLALTLTGFTAGAAADTNPTFPRGILPFPVPGPVPARLSNTEVYERLLRSTVCVVQPPSEGNWYLGSGWIVDRERRLVVTNHHVVGQRDLVHIHFPIYEQGKLVSERRYYLANVGRTVRGRVLDSDKQRDLAVVQLESLPETMVALPLAADSPRQGEQVHQVGNPSGSEAFWVYTTGSVRQVYQRQIRYRNQTVEARIIESQCPSNPGDSGGPVVNDRGELVGTHTGSTTDSRLITWHIDVGEVRNYVDQTRKLMTPTTAHDYNERGVRLFIRGKYEPAAADFTAAIKLDGQVALYYQNRADALLNAGGYDAALHDAEEAVRLAPTDARSHFMRGYSHEMKQDLDAALADYTTALKHKADYALVYEYRGDVHGKKGNADAALADFTAALKLNPQNAGCLKKRGDIHRNREAYDLALADYDKALALGPTANLLNVCAICFDGKQDHRRAIVLYTKALELEPKDAIILSNRARTWLVLKQYDQSLADCTAAIQLDPKNAYHYVTRGKVYEQIDDSRSQADYARALALDPSQESQLPLHQRRYLRVRNTTSEVLQITVQYETWTTNGNWQWFTATWTFKPGESSYLNHDGFKVNGRRIRIWAKSPTGQYVTYKDKDVTLATAEGYRAFYGFGTFTFTFGK